METTPRVMIDLNSTDEDGETIAFLSDVSAGKLTVGRMAIAYEPEDGVYAPARVASIHEDRGVAFLQVDWRAMRRETPQSHSFRLSRAGWASSSAVATSAAQTHLTHSATRGITLRSAAGS